MSFTSLPFPGSRVGVLCVGGGGAARGGGGSRRPGVATPPPPASPKTRPLAAAHAAPCSTYRRGDFGRSDVDHFLLFRELSLLDGFGRALPDISSMDQDRGRCGRTLQA